MGSNDLLGVAKVADDENGEHFIILARELELGAKNKGYFLCSSGPLTEDETRAALVEMGQPETLIDRMLNRARDVFRKT